MDIGKTTRRHRRLAGLTQQEVARRLGMDRTAIGRIERGERVPRADTFLALLGVCGADIVLERWGPPPELGPDAGTIGGREAEMLRSLAFRRVRCVVIGALAERIHGSDVAAHRVEIVAACDPANGRRVERVREIAVRRMRPSAPLRVLWRPPRPFTAQADLLRDAVEFQTETSHLMVAGPDQLIAMRLARSGPGDRDAAARMAAARRLSRRGASGTPPRR